MKPKRSGTAVEKFYLRYEKIAEHYAKQIYNYERYGYEFQDIVQELRIKVYMSVIGYGKKWGEYKRTGRFKPVPLEYYIKSALSNRTKDFIKTFNQESVENVDKLSLQSNSFDYGVYSTMTSTMNLSAKECEINGIDLFAKLGGVERQCFALYLKGFSISKLKIVFKRKRFDVEGTINRQLSYIRSHKRELYDFYTDTYKMYSFAEEETA